MFDSSWIANAIAFLNFIANALKVRKDRPRKGDPDD